MDDPEMRIMSGDGLKRALLITGSVASLMLLAACNDTAPTAHPAQTSTAEVLPSRTSQASESPTEPATGWPAQELQLSGNPDLKALATYGDILQHQVPDEFMTFTGMPRTPEQAESDAAAMAGTLKQFHDAGIKPLVIMEPSSYDDGSILDLNSIARGGSDSTMTIYYQALKAQGITDEMMGEWVVLPEANTPAWNNTDPETVRSGIIHLAQAQKAVFPGSRVSVMLDSETYKSNDRDYANGQYKSLVPYVHDMPKGLVDSFGLQGFPWIDAGAPPAEVNAPAEFLPAQMAVEAARTLGVRDIWFNTGTFASTHDDDPSGRVVMGAPQRQALLQAINDQAMAAKAAGFNVTVNVFAANKEHTDEATDWSYRESAADIKVLADFIAGERQNGIKVSLFDSLAP